MTMRGIGCFYVTFSNKIVKRRWSVTMLINVIKRAPCAFERTQLVSLSHPISTIFFVAPSQAAVEQRKYLPVCFFLTLTHSLRPRCGSI